MKLVRSHKIFRLLRDLSVLRRQKLRRYRRVQHIRQYRAKLLIPAGIRVVAHQVAHQRLRNGGIDRIHGHMVAVICRPAECKLREIAGSDDHAALFVGNVHQNLRPLSCLAVLIGHIMNGRILPDITEMHIHRFLDVDFRKIRSEAPDQGHRVVIGPVRRPEARHRDCLDPVVRHAEQIERAHGDKQRQCGIQTARNAHNRRLTVRMFQTLF